MEKKLDFFEQLKKDGGVFNETPPSFVLYSMESSFFSSWGFVTFRTME